MTTRGKELQPGLLPRFTLWRVLIYIVLIAFAVFYLLPVYVLIITGLKSFAEVNLYRMWDLPKGFYLDSFAKAWLGSQAEGFRGLSGNFFNSVRLTVPATILSAMLGSINGYVLAKWKFRGSNVIFPLLLFGMFIPYQSILIPLVVVLSKIPWFGGSLYGSLPGLILAHVVYGIPITTHLQHLSPHFVSPVAAGLRGGHDLAVHFHLERFPVCRDGHRRPPGTADHRRAEQPGRQLHRSMERADGRGADRRFAHPGRVHFPGPVLHARYVGGVFEGIRTQIGGSGAAPFEGRQG
jgi:hypothetical protein